VVDVATAHVDGPFTYTTGGSAPALGARVRVPFGGRLVGGWVVSDPAPAQPDASLKAIVDVEDESPRFDAEAVHLAAWLRGRYACTFREALASVAPRGAAMSARSRFAFPTAPDASGATADALFGAFGARPFTPIAAVRALKRAGLRMSAQRAQAELARAVRLGTLQRVQEREKAKRARTTSSEMCLVLADAALAKGAGQRRLAAALGEHDGKLPSRQACKLAAVGSDVIRRATKAGVIRQEPLAQAAATAGTIAGRRPSMTATAEQRRAIETLDAAMKKGPVVALLHGVTGSGKTFVYSRLIDRLRRRGGRAIVLVPEIALTPQTSARFIAIFGERVGVLHSGLSDGERARVWNQAAAGDLDVVVGARSAVFAPLPKLALIVVDEEHEPSYKQDVAPRYDAAAVARERMARSGGAVILGSATPSLESYQEAISGGIAYVRMSQRATSAPMPPVQIVDMTAEKSMRGRQAVGPALVERMDAALKRGQKVILFVNRRGYAGLLLCRACGFAPRCRRCAISLVLHSADGSLRCHVCGDAFKVPNACPKCRSLDLLPYGFGTQRVEETIGELFPAAKIIRMDADTTTGRGAHGRLLHSFGAEGDVLIGTQMIAKGLDYPSVTVVGVVSADVDLNRPDFRAAERTFSLLTQVAGRAGRAAPGSNVVVQTYSPDHYAVRLAAAHDYETFARKELALRRELRYPPFGRLAYIGLAGVDASAVGKVANMVAEELRANARGVETLGPAPDPLPKARGEYRMRIALKSESEADLLDACRSAQRMRRDPDVRMHVVVDPR
jgi:primosomal protein N' (replication factor Y) (superfamily II helicase)